MCDIGVCCSFLGFELLTSSRCVFRVKDYSFLTITMSGIGTVGTFPAKKSVFFSEVLFLEDQLKPSDSLSQGWALGVVDFVGGEGWEGGITLLGTL